MVKKRKILKIAFSVATIVCVIMSMVTPAMAFGIRNGYALGGGWYHGLTGGSVRLYPQPPDEITKRQFEFDLPIEDDYGILSQNEYSLFSVEQNRLYSNDTSYDCFINVYNCRKALNLNGARYWVARNYLLFCYADGNNEFHSTDGFTFTFDSFAMRYSEVVLGHMFSFYCTVPTVMTVTFTELGNDGISFTYVDEYKYTGGEGWVYPLQEVASYFAESHPDAEPVLITELTIDVKQYTSTAYDAPLYADGCQYGILTQQYTSADQLDKILGNYSVADFWYELSQNVGNAPDVPSVEDNSFISFVASSVVSFFSVELFPGFSLGGVLGVALSVCIMLVLLKFFGGG